jgi:hypothetical protein
VNGNDPSSAAKLGSRVLCRDNLCLAGEARHLPGKKMSGEVGAVRVGGRSFLRLWTW